MGTFRDTQYNLQLTQSSIISEKEEAKNGRGGERRKRRRVGRGRGALTWAEDMQVNRKLCFQRGRKIPHCFLFLPVGSLLASFAGFFFFFSLLPTLLGIMGL